MPIVYITQIPARHAGANNWVPSVDVTPAREFGEVEILLSSGMNFPTGGEVTEMLRRQLSAFKPDEDFILPLGDPVVQAAATAILGSMHGVFRMLKWDRQDKKYHAFTIEV